MECIAQDLVDVDSLVEGDVAKRDPVLRQSVLVDQKELRRYEHV